MGAQALPSRSRPKLNPYTKALRRERIFINLRLGHNYQEIAGEEWISDRRVRKIVSDTIAKRSILGPKDHALLQRLRLENAHKLAAAAVAAGNLDAIGPLCKVVDRIGRHKAKAPWKDEYDAAAREKLLAKLNRVAARIDAREAAAARRAASNRPTEAAPGPRCETTPISA